MAIAWVVGALALVALAAGLLAWQVSRVGARRESAMAFIDSRLAMPQSQSAHRSEPAARQTRRPANAFDHLLVRAGKVATAGFYSAHLGVLAVSLALGAWVGGALAATIAGASVVVAAYFRLWWLAERRQRRMIAQLPVFLDAVVRLITIGNSLGAAFQSAADSVDFPLREVVVRVASQNRSGKDLDAALASTASLYGLRELHLVSAVVAVALRYGGRSDHVLDRMSAFIRDLQQARQELSAMSSEVRLSAWILALLPLGIAAYIVMFNSALFMQMWHDPTGFKMLVGAVILQAVGCYGLYRMARAI